MSHGQWVKQVGNWCQLYLAEASVAQQAVVRQQLAQLYEQVKLWLAAQVVQYAAQIEPAKQRLVRQIRVHMNDHDIEGFLACWSADPDGLMETLPEQRLRLLCTELMLQPVWRSIDGWFQMIKQMRDLAVLGRELADLAARLNEQQDHWQAGQLILALRHWRVLRTDYSVTLLWLSGPSESNVPTVADHGQIENPLLEEWGVRDEEIAGELSRLAVELDMVGFDEQITRRYCERLIAGHHEKDGGERHYLFAAV